MLDDLEPPNKWQFWYHPVAYEPRYKIVFFTSVLFSFPPLFLHLSMPYPPSWSGACADWRALDIQWPNSLHHSTHNSARSRFFRPPRLSQPSPFLPFFPQLFMCGKGQERSPFLFSPLDSYALFVHARGATHLVHNKHTRG